MQTNKIFLNKWYDYKYNLGSQFVSDIHISLALDFLKRFLFLSSIEKGIPFENLKLLIFFKITTTNNQKRTISFMQTIDFEEFSLLYPLFIEFWNLKTEDYYLAIISDIIFTYKLVDASITPVSKSKLLTSDYKKTLKRTNKNVFKFGGFNLPATMDITNTKWGNCHFISENKAIVYKNYSSLEYHVELFDKHQIVELKLNSKTILTFKDIMTDSTNLSSFTRVLKNHEYKFENGILIIKKIEKNVSFLTKTPRDIYNSKKFITMDLETRVINNIMTPYCVSIYDGKIFKSFYLTDFFDENEMLRESILFLMKRKYHNYRVYLHNFSRFDSVFLLSVLTDLSNKVKPVIREGNIIDLRLDFANKYSIFFRDSYLLLPGSLRNLAKNFNVENKGIFPYSFVNNLNNSLEYVGAIPNIKYFDGLNSIEYTAYCSNPEFVNDNWNLKTQTIKYCELDCLVLYQILDLFSDKIFALFRIDILKNTTLSSLALNIYRINFLKDAKIPLIYGDIYNFIKRSYTGGSVDVYKPKSDNNSLVLRYDVNSLYSYGMKHFSMPVGNPVYFEGDILNIGNNNSNDKPYGIFEVDIIAPTNIKYPLLQTRIKTKNGYRTIAPVGNWSGVYFSDELYNASKFGYTFKVKRGYLFNKGNIFSEYVDFIFNLKKNSKKGTPDYTISKLLLNSLYGRLGMDPIAEQHVILLYEEAIKLYPKINVTNVLDLKNGKELISFFTLPSEYSVEPEKEYSIKNTSVVIASIVTASARIYMSQFKTDPTLIIYYTDTDSIDINRKLPSYLIGDGLGQMKLEHIFDEALFLGPKMYGGKTSNYEYVRIKGLKNPIAYANLKTLLKKDSSLEIKQEKWYSDISNGKFHIKDEIYTLMVTDNKRKLLYNKENIFIDTQPLILENGKLIN